MEPSFELFDHTADIGIRARAATLPELAKVAGDGLYAVIGELVAAGDPREWAIELQDSDPAVLLRDYLDELLVLFDRDHRRATDIVIKTFDDANLVARITTQLVDGERSDYRREVKAITYHELEIRQVSGGYEATVIVDI